MKIFSWDMSYLCNFKCEYCFFTTAGWENIRKKHGKLKAPDIIEKAWENVCDRYGAVKILITGGEPFLYPKFAEILQRISKYHNIHVTTNLSQPLDDLIKLINPVKVELNSTFHPAHIDIETFSHQIMKLRKSGFTCGVCYLAHPTQLREMLYYKRYFMKQNIDMALTIFWGYYLGKNYPDGYTDEERNYCLKVSKWTSEADEYLLTGNRYENVAADDTDEQLANLKPEITNGNQCNAGYKYATIEVSGAVKPCGQSPGPELGNLYDNNIELCKKPIICKAKYCKCRETDYMVTK
jgi:MoaA/NifB/PqqE/SkfB family radical SAM enzyme